MNDSLLQINKDILDSSNTLTNFANSILAHFGVKPFHSTIREVDEAIKGHKKIAVFLFDGASEYNLSLYPNTTRFIRSHKLKTIHSVNPATTVACTTAFLSARFPIETGWLGWSLNFPSFGPVDAFTGKGSYDKKQHDPDLMKKTAPYESIISLLQKNGVHAKASFEYPVENEEGPKTHREAVKQYTSFFKEGGEFLYGYFKNPDKTLHDHGEKSWHAWWEYKKIVWFLKRFTKNNPDVIVFSFADHGLINVRYDDLSDYPDLESCLSYPISLDARIPTFFVKKGMEEQFEKAFEKHLSKDFLLLKKEEALANHYFGEGKESKASLSFLGDYIGVAKNNTVLKEYFGKKDEHPLKAHHSGASAEEKNILLAVYNR